MKVISSTRAACCRLAAASVLLLVALVGAQPVAYAQDNGARWTPNASADASRSYVPSLFGGQPIAIDVGQPSAPSNEAPPPVGVVGSNAQDSTMVEPWAPYVRNPAQHYLLYGMTAAGTFQHEGASADVPADSLWMSSLSPYVGLMARTRTGFYALQYAPNIVPYDSQTQSASVFQNLSLDAAGSFTRRLRWTFDLQGGYGSEASRLTGNLNAQQVVNGVPVASTGYASVQPFGGDSLNSSAGFGLSYQLSSRQTVRVTVNDSYSAFTFSPANPATPNMHSDMATLGLTFDEAISQRVTLRAYGAQSRLFSNLLPCSSFSGGLGMLFQPSRTLGVDLGAGPSTGCGAQSANFHGTVSGSLHKNQIHFYAGASRQLNTLYRLNSRWEDDAMGGVGRSFRSAELGFDGGYYHGQSLGLLAPSQGYFLSPRINYRLRLSRFTSVGLAYRRFHSAQPTGAGGDVSFVMVSVSFSPLPVPLER